MLTVARPTHCMPYAHCYKELSVPNASLLQGLLVQGIISTLAIYASLLQCSLLPFIISVMCLPVTRHHQCPMPPCYKAHCCKASSVPYASLLQDSLLQAPLPAYLASLLCVIIAFIQRCVGLCFIPVMVWSGLCFIPRRSGLVWSGLVCVLYPTVPSPSFFARRRRRTPLGTAPACRHAIDSRVNGIGNTLRAISRSCRHRKWNGNCAPFGGKSKICHCML